MDQPPFPPKVKRREAYALVSYYPKEGGHVVHRVYTKRSRAEEDMALCAESSNKQWEIQTTPLFDENDYGDFG